MWQVNCDYKRNNTDTKCSLRKKSEKLQRCAGIRKS